MSRFATLAVVMLFGVPALGADRYVSSSGSDAANDCLTSVAPCATIPWAVDQAGSGDVVKIAGGIYREHVRLDGSRDVTLSGGWSVDFAVRQPAVTPTFWKTSRTFVSGYSNQVVILALAPSTMDVHVVLDGIVFKSGKGGTAVYLGLEQSDRVRLDVVDVTFDHNRGSGVEATLYSSSQLIASLQRTRFTRNRNSYLLGGFSVRAYGNSVADVEITNCIFSRNRMPGISALALGAGPGSPRTEGSPAVNVALVNSTLDANRGNAVAGTVDGPSGTTLVIEARNSVVYGTVPFRGASVGIDLAALVQPGSGGSLTVRADHSLYGSTGLSGGALLDDAGGNLLGVDPEFVRGDKGYHLAPGSPLIDAGTDGAVPLDDLDGDPRPLDGDSVPGAVTDIGADEFTP